MSYAIAWTCIDEHPDRGDYTVVEWPPNDLPPTHLATLAAGPWPTHHQAAEHYLTAPGQPRPTP